MKFDLHSHTNASDGVLSPAELVRRAAQFEVSVLAITDHDSQAGLAVARKTIAQEQLPVRLIAGVEISSQWQNHEIHVVGLAMNENCPEWLAFLAGQSQRRLERAQEIGRRLAKCQLNDTFLEAKALAGDGALTRAHFAHVLVNRGVADSVQSVFKKYLSRGNKGYAPANWPNMEQAIAAIQQAGGLAVLAHPTRYDLSSKWVKRLIIAFKAAGGDGMEVCLSQQAPQERANLGQWAKEHDLYLSLGSDFHFPSQWTELGRHLWLPKEGVPIWFAYPKQFALTEPELLQLQATR